MEFGEDKNSIWNVKQQLKVFPKLSSVESQLLMRDRYEQYYGIFDHDADHSGDSLALVTRRPAEGNSEHSLLYGRMRDFAKKKVPRYFNLSLTEFLNLPRDMVLEILKICNEMAKEEHTAKAKDDADLLKALGAQANKFDKF